MTSAKNDFFRRTFLGGTVVLTRGIAALPDESRIRILKSVREFDAFTEDNDPYGEHDFGSIQANGSKVFWKIDDHQGNEGLNLVLTIMRADEY